MPLAKSELAAANTATMFAAVSRRFYEAFANGEEARESQADQSANRESHLSFVHNPGRRWRFHVLHWMTGWVDLKARDTTAFMNYLDVVVLKATRRQHGDIWLGIHILQRASANSVAWVGT